MPRLVIPNSVSLQNIRSFVEQPALFDTGTASAVLEFHPAWVHMEPVALAMAAAWGAWARRNGFPLEVKNLSPKTAYAGRMKLFELLGVEDPYAVAEHESSGRFVPLTNVKTSSDVGGVVGDISALLHLQDDLETLHAVQYSVSELLRNVIEHSNSPDGAFVCAHRFVNEPSRVTIAVADCGQGIRQHLSHAHSVGSDEEALRFAMQPGVTGAVPGPYGTSDNAGAGLFITRSIAKGSGGYFFILSDTAAYRLRRGLSEDAMSMLFMDPYEEPRHDVYAFTAPWQGTVVSLEVRTEQIANYEGFFQWIFERIPRQHSTRELIRFS